MLTTFLAAKYARQQNCPLNIEAMEVLLGSLFSLKKKKKLLIFHWLYKSHETKESLENTAVCPDFAGDLFKASELSDTGLREERVL